MTSFKSFPLPESLLNSLEKLKLDKPTEVQTKTIPLALDGKDIIVSAPTGTGKTLSFCIPVIKNLLSDPHYNAIIITPTRELASQIMDVFKSLLNDKQQGEKHKNISNADKPQKQIKSALLIGGTAIEKQLNQLKKRPQLIVGTPGRINDHLTRKTLKLGNTKFVVLDEMDRMLDMGFSIQIDEIFKFLPEKRQILMLSATIPPPILQVSKKYLKLPSKVTVSSSEIVNTNIKQEFLEITKDEKYHELLDQLHKRDGTVIVFVKTRRNSEELAKRLSNDSFKSKAIHGDLRQHQREKIIRLYRKGEYRIVVATDVAARGIDVPHIKHVINYNLPTNPEDYVHRVGRTGRAGKEGHALSFISPNEKKEWYALECFLDPSKVKPKNNPNNRNRSNSRRRKPNDRSAKGSFGRRNNNQNKKPKPNSKPKGFKGNHRPKS